MLETDFFVEDWGDDHFPGDEGVRTSISVLQERVVRERTAGPSCPQTPAGGLSTWSGWSCNQSTLSDGAGAENSNSALVEASKCTFHRWDALLTLVVASSELFPPPPGVCREMGVQERGCALGQGAIIAGLVDTCLELGVRLLSRTTYCCYRTEKKSRTPPSPGPQRVQAARLVKLFLSKS